MLMEGEHQYYIDDLAAIEHLQSLNDPTIYDASKFNVVKVRLVSECGCSGGWPFCPSE